jgi:predicted dehydrogenase
MKNSMTRRRFLRRSAATAGAVKLLSYAGPAWAVSPNDKLNVACIGTANQAKYDMDNVSHESVVAICDVDELFLRAAAERNPSAKKFRDFRKVLDEKNIDAVVVGTPDHTHAIITASALSSGRHVYCEKPLAHSVAEVRHVTELAKKKGLVTQIGTQIHGGGNYRRVVELLHAGAVGDVNEIHVWVGGGFGGKKRPTEPEPVPATLDYEAWLGPVEFRPYSHEYLPFTWRNWWAFGGGTLADLGCHHIDLSYWAFGFHAPKSVRIVEGPPPEDECPPTELIVEYTYPAAPAPMGNGKPVTLRWYHGHQRPPQFAQGLLPKWGNGSLFVGSKGMLLADYDKHVLLPEKDFATYQGPGKSIPDSIGHHREWTEACKGRGKTLCGFQYSGPLTEAVLLGNVAFRAGSALEWDAKAMKARNCRAADQFIHYKYRAGWKLPS